MPRRKKVTQSSNSTSDDTDVIVEETPQTAPPAAVAKKRAPKKAPSKPTKAPAKTPAKKAPAKKPAPKKVVPPPSEDGNEPTKRTQRSFQILVESITPTIDKSLLSKDGGRFVGKMPSQSARKAFNSIARAHAQDPSREDVPCKYVFSIKEITRKSAQRVFTYEGERILLDTPRVVKRGGSEYSVKFETKLHSLRGKTVAASD